MNIILFLDILCGFTALWALIRVISIWMWSKDSRIIAMSREGKSPLAEDIVKTTCMVVAAIAYTIARIF